MKILVAHNLYQSVQIGGEDLVFRSELQALRDALGKENVFEYAVSNDNLAKIDLITGIWYSKQHYQAVDKIIKKNKINLLHVHNFFPQLTPSVFQAAKDNNIKTIQTLHNYRPWCLAGTLYRNNSFCDKCVNLNFTQGVISGCYRGSRVQSLVSAMAHKYYHHNNYFDKIDRFFVLSNTQKSRLKDIGVCENKIYLKPNFIVPPEKPILAKDKQNFLFVGRLEESKGIKLLISAWKNLPKNYNLDIIGEGPLLQWVIKHVRGLSVRVLGKRSHQETQAIMQQSKYFIHPGLAEETFGLTIIEAFACGTPVIGFDVGTRSEFIKHKENGFISTPDTLADTIKIANAYQGYDKLYDNSIKSSKLYEIDQILPQQLEYYNNLIGS